MVNSGASSGENNTPVHVQHRLQAKLGLLVRSSRHNKHLCICCLGLVKSTLNGFLAFTKLKIQAVSKQLILEYYPFFLNGHNDMRQTPEAPKTGQTYLDWH